MGQTIGWTTAVGLLIALQATGAAAQASNAQASNARASNAQASNAQASDTAAALSRTRRELACLSRSQGRIGSAIRLLREAEAQLRSRSASAAARNDAAKAAESLERRLQGLAQELSGCIEAAPASAEDAEVVYREPPPDPAADAVAQPNQAVADIDRDRALAGYVRVLVGQRVDGHGQVDPGSIRRAMNGIGPTLSACYAELVDHGALERGTLILVFTVTTDGGIARVQLERPEVGGPHFHRCVRNAGRRMRVAARARGGSATYSYTLRFGPDE